MDLKFILIYAGFIFIKTVTSQDTDLQENENHRISKFCKKSTYSTVYHL